VSGRFLGEIVLLQVQRMPVKVLGGRYDPAPLIRVAEALVGPDGVLGFDEGAWVLDVHHAAHPARRGSAGRAVSLGFTGHYRLMEGHFGVAPPGIGGENLVVDAPGRWFAEDLAGEVVVRTAAGELALTGATPAAPCLHFTSFLLGLDRVAGRAEIADHLDFLGEGMRGFVLGVRRGTAPVLLRPGDEVWVRPAG
jgi:hypothetical protein